MAVAPEVRNGRYKPRPHCLRTEGAEFRRKKAEIPPFIPFLPDVPVPSERNPNPERVETASHELGHTLTALELGIGVNRVTTRPNGNILGSTEISGMCDNSSFQIIAAAGAVDTCHGAAKGYGSDLTKVYMIHRYEGGMSPAEAIRQAHSRIVVLSPEVRKRAAEILAHMEEVSGHQIPDIILRAEWEIKMEKMARGEKEAPFEFKEEEINHIFPHQFEDHDEKTEIGYKGNNEYTFTTKLKDKEIGKSDFCAVCEKENGHKPDLHPAKEPMRLLQSN